MNWKFRVVAGCSALLFASAFGSVGARAATTDGAVVIASQGGVQLTMADIDVFAESIPAERRAPFFDSRKRLATLISNLLVQKQLAAAARANGLDKQVAAEGKLSDERLADAETTRFKNTLQIPSFEELAHEQYIAHAEKYDLPATLDVEHVLITSIARADAEAKALADTVESEARKDPAQFEALVDKYSDDSDKKNHGLVAHAYDNPAHAFAEAAKALNQPGDISPVTKTENGYQVLKLISKAPARRKTFDEVRPQLLESLKSEYVDRAFKDRVDELRNKPLDANVDLVESLRTRYVEKNSAPSPMPDIGTAKKTAQ